jgi:predicted metal-dependent phosphotriesterase family hydrolase
MKRRAFLATLAAGGSASPALLRSPSAAATPRDTGRIITVRGPIEAAQMGTTLVHEHVLVDFVGADRVSRSRYDANAVFRLVLPHLKDLRARGCQTLVECTPAYLGRDPLLLRRLSEASDLQILTNTGYYGAARDRYLPPQALSETAQKLAVRWTSEFRHGIERSGVRPGFLKTGVDAGPLSGIDRKLVDAAALCHLETGLTIAVHTGDGRAALEVQDAVRRAGVSAEAWIWVHASQERDRATRERVAQAGAWIELDGLAPETLDAHVEGVIDMARRGLLGRTLVSQDAGWYDPGKPNGGPYRTHAFLFDTFLPALRTRGLGDAEIRQLLVLNPARAFAVRVRATREPRAASG